MSYWDAIRRAVKTLFPDLSEDARQKLALSPAMLKTAYRRQMLAFHPDRHSGSNDEHYHEHTCSIQEAYRHLESHLLKQRPLKTPRPTTRSSAAKHSAPSTELQFGEFLIREGIVSREALNHVLREQHHRRPSFGSVAVSLGYLGPNELSRWLEYQSKYPGRLGTILIRERRLSQCQVDAIVAAQIAYCEPIGVLLCKRGFARASDIEAAHERFQGFEYDTPRAA